MAGRVGKPFYGDPQSGRLIEVEKSLLLLFLHVLEVAVRCAGGFDD